MQILKDGGHKNLDKQKNSKWKLKDLIEKKIAEKNHKKMLGNGTDGNNNTTK